jgi:NAD(P)-dependent dehydrogenase (short-subunit alcohol dehydrogenase family)
MVMQFEGKVAFITGAARGQGRNGALENLLPVPMIESADVTEAMVYLCGQSGRYVTGITLPVDAGYTVK